MKMLFVLFVLCAGSAAAACPDPSLGQDPIAASGPDLLAPQRWTVTVDGAEQAPCATWRDGGVIEAIDGYLPVAPSASFELSGLGPHILMVMAEATCSPILAVQSADGLWHFGETANGREEVVVWSASDGPLQVWVGSTEQTQCDGVVVLETFDR